jgi:HEPN domain-containing protein
VERIHSIFILIRGSKREKVSGIPELASLADEAKELDKVYIPTRYPNGIPFGILAEFYTRKNGEDCIRWAGRIIEAVQKILPIT